MQLIKFARNRTFSIIQNGYAVTEVQPLLGHNSLNTTMIYLHMASPLLLRVKSPLDILENPQKAL